VPVLVLQGERTALPWFTRGNRHLAEHVPDCEVRTIPGVGHGGPGLAPEAIARELVRFLQSEHEPA
jgi:pimeloyl-ACP methyl ester carboxylesterase